MHVLESSNAPHKTHTGLWRWIAGAGIVFVLAASMGIYFVNEHWPYRYREIKPLLEDDFGSQVFITRYHRTYFPHPGFVAMGVRLHRRSAPDAPDIGYAETVVVQGTWRQLCTLQRRVALVDVAGLHIVLPPRGSRALAEDFPPGSSSDFTGPDTSISRFELHDAVLEIQGDKNSKLLFKIPELDFNNVEKNKAAAFHLRMVNPVPSGTVMAAGTFGPLNAKDLAATPLSGQFTFNGVKLADLGDVSGTLDSSGTFGGALGAVQAHATAHVPNFSVARGRATVVDGSVQCTIDGLHGDLALNGIQVKTGATLLNASGAINGSPNRTNLDIDVPGGRAEDVLKPFIQDDVPIAGPVWLHAHAYLAPTTEGPFLHRLHLSGVFRAAGQKITDKKTQQSLTDFSHRAEDHDRVQNDSAPNRDVLSSLKGVARIEDGVASSSHLTFDVPGAQADVSGTFALESKAVHLIGSLRMETDISHTTTGFKSVLLKPLAPFFRKKHAGAVVPIAVLGSPGHYQVTQNLEHKK